MVVNRGLIQLFSDVFCSVFFTGVNGEDFFFFERNQEGTVDASKM